MKKTEQTHFGNQLAGLATIYSVSTGRLCAFLYINSDQSALHRKIAVRCKGVASFSQDKLCLLRLEPNHQPINTLRVEEGKFRIILEFRLKVIFFTRICIIRLETPQITETQKPARIRCTCSLVRLQQAPKATEQGQCVWRGARTQARLIIGAFLQSDRITDVGLREGPSIGQVRPMEATAAPSPLGPRGICLPCAQVQPRS